MINEIIYFYNLFPSKVYNENGKYKFFLNGFYYYFFSFDDIDKLEYSYKLSLYLIRNGFYCHSFVLNVFDNFYSTISNINYVLFKCNDFCNSKIDIDYLIYYYNSFYLFNNEYLIQKMRNSFIDRVDYMEYEIENYKLKYPVIFSSSRYFIGLAELSIQLLYKFSGKLNVSINHSKLLNFDDVFEFYNPLNFIIDYNIRDFAEYVKYCFFYKDLSFDKIKKYILKFIKSNDESIVFLSRLIFPSYFFELCDSIFFDQVSESKIYFIINKIDSFEKFVNDIYSYLNLYFNLPYIDFFFS